MSHLFVKVHKMMMVIIFQFLRNLTKMMGALLYQEGARLDILRYEGTRFYCRVGARQLMSYGQIKTLMLK